MAYSSWSQLFYDFATVRVLLPRVYHYPDTNPTIIHLARLNRLGCYSLIQYIFHRYFLNTHRVLAV